MRKTAMAALTTLLFAVHPVHGEGPKQQETPKPAAAAPAPHPAAPDQAVRHAADTSPAGPFPSELQQQTVIPEVSTQVNMSSSDANRVVCSQEIKDVIFSGEKGVSVKVSGKNAFVKFRIQRKDERDIYSQTPTELFVVCGESVYNLIAVPRRIPAQTVRLSPGPEKIRKNAALFGGLPFEKKVIAVIRAVYTGEVPEGFIVTALNRRISLYKEMTVTQVRSFRVEGEGLLVNEFTVSSAKSGEELKITEKDFLREQVALRPVAIALDRHTLKDGETARVIVVEKAPAAGEGGGNGAQGED